MFDGTMSWLPFVEQTIQMARDHKHHYVRWVIISLQTESRSHVKVTAHNQVPTIISIVDSSDGKLVRSGFIFFL